MSISSSCASSHTTSPTEVDSGLRKKKAEFEPSPGHAIDWNLFHHSGASWRPEAEEILERTGLRALCSEPCDIYMDVLNEFYQTVELQAQTSESEEGGEGEGEEEEDREVQHLGQLVARIGDTEVSITPSSLRRTFEQPHPHSPHPLPILHEMASAMNYDDQGKFRKRRYYSKTGFQGSARFFAFVLGKTIFCQRTGTDSVPLVHMQCLYSLVNGISIDWAVNIFREWSHSLDHKGYGRLLIKILQRHYPRVLDGREATPYPSKLILRGFREDGRVFAIPLSVKGKTPKRKITEEKREIRAKKTASDTATVAVAAPHRKAVLDTLWISYAKATATQDEVRQCWLRLGQSKIGGHDLLGWGVVGGHITTAQSEQLLRDLPTAPVSAAPVPPPPAPLDSRLSAVETELADLRQMIRSESAQQSKRIDRLFELWQRSGVRQHSSTPPDAPAAHDGSP